MPRIAQELILREVSVRTVFSCRLALLSAVFLGAASSLAQPVTIPLVTPSKPGCPIVLRGSLTAITKQDQLGHSFDSFEGSILAINVSPKNVVLVITKMRTTGVVVDAVTNIGIHDYFFSTETFEPNDTKEFPEFGPPVILSGTAVPRSAGARARAEATVVFVQFVDGSTWGDPATGEEAFRQRNLAWNKLKSLAEILRTRGDQEFLTELMQPHEPGFLGDAFVERVQSVYRASHDGAKAATEELNRLLHVAASHQRAMESLAGANNE